MSIQPRTSLNIMIYDIVEDKNRTKVFKILSRYSVAIQKSAFEGRLTRAEREAVIRSITPFLNPKTDRFVMYSIGSRQEDSIRVIGMNRPKHPVQTFFII